VGQSGAGGFLGRGGAGGFLGRGGADGLERLALDVDGVRRTYWLARAPGLSEPVGLMAPYQGGPLRARGVAGWILRRRAARHGDLPSQRRIVPVETVATDWAAGNGITGEPFAVRLRGEDGDPPTVRLTWSASGYPPVVLYRIEGGGHGWPGGPQYLSARVIGPVPRHLDASKILLDMVTAGR
jgi:poly(3-hydroxybutyrate) depolymerase